MQSENTTCRAIWNEGNTMYTCGTHRIPHFQHMSVTTQGGTPSDQRATNISRKSNHRGPRQPHPLNKKVDHTICNPQSYCNTDAILNNPPRIQRTRPPENIERALSHIPSSDGRGTSRPTTSHTRRHSPQTNPSHSSSPDQTRNRIAIQNPRPILAQSPRNRRTKPPGNIEQGRGTGTASLSTTRHTTGQTYIQIQIRVHNDLELLVEGPDHSRVVHHTLTGQRRRDPVDGLSLEGGPSHTVPHNHNDVPAILPQPREKKPSNGK